MEYNRQDYLWNRDKEFYPIAINDIMNTIDIHLFDTVLPLLKELDYPAIPERWEHLVEYCMSYGEEPKVVLKKYISSMWLQAYKPFRFADSDRFNNTKECCICGESIKHTPYTAKITCDLPFVEHNLQFPTMYVCDKCANALKEMANMRWKIEEV